MNHNLNVELEKITRSWVAGMGWDICIIIFTFLILIIVVGKGSNHNKNNSVKLYKSLKVNFQGALLLKKKKSVFCFHLCTHMCGASIYPKRASAPPGTGVCR